MKYDIDINNKNDIKQFNKNHNRAKAIVKYIYRDEIKAEAFNKLKIKHQIGELRIKELKEEFLDSYRHDKEAINTIMLFNELEEVYNKVNNNNIKIIELEAQKRAERKAVISKKNYYNAIQKMNFGYKRQY